MLTPTRVLTVAVDRPGAYPSIGSALLEAPDGCAIAIAAGTYAETLELSNRRITLQAEAGRPSYWTGRARTARRCGQWTENSYCADSTYGLVTTKRWLSTGRR
jgi:hypothetical protein